MLQTANKNVIDYLREFDTETNDWSIFARCLHNYFEANDIQENEKKKIIK